MNKGVFVDRITNGTKSSSKISRSLVKVYVEKSSNINLLIEEIVKMGAIISISQINDLEPYMNKLFTDKKFTKNLIEKSQKFIESYLSNKGNASQILAEELNKF